MKNDNPTSLTEELANLNACWADFVKTVKAEFWKDVDRIKACWQRYRMRRALKNIRGTLMSFGITTAHMTDEELATHIIFVSKELGRAFDKFGVSCAEAARSFQMLGHALRTLEIEKDSENER